jgi:hypothetical protein
MSAEDRVEAAAVVAQYVTVRHIMRRRPLYRHIPSNPDTALLRYVDAGSDDGEHDQSGGALRHRRHDRGLQPGESASTLSAGEPPCLAVLTESVASGSCREEGCPSGSD